MYKVTPYQRLRYDLDMPAGSGISCPWQPIGSGIWRMVCALL
jgi:hypothetical protein